MTTFLNETQLQKTCPSIFATGGAHNTSERYGFIPTIDVVRGLEKAGFMPVMAGQGRTRSKDKAEHVRHLMRFRHIGDENQREVFPEIVMVNSHDGSTSYQLRAGIFRMVCTNGLIVGDEMFCRRVKHSGNVIEKVVEAASDLLEIVPLSVTKSQEWKGIKLKKEAAEVLAATAMSLKWDQEEFPLSNEQVLRPRRRADEKTDLWTTFNVIQENLIKGGIPYRTPEGMRNRTRETSSIHENVRLNTALWALTEKMAELLK